MKADDSFFEAFEKLRPEKGQDVDALSLTRLIRSLPANNGDIQKALHILDCFQKARTPHFSKSLNGGIWLGRSYAVFADYPELNDAHVFTMTHADKYLKAAVLGYQYEGNEQKWVRSILSSLERKDRRSLLNYQKILSNLIKGIQTDAQDQLFPLELTNGVSLQIQPKNCVKIFIRQIDDELLLVEPARSGGWYSRLYLI